MDEGTEIEEVCRQQNIGKATYHRWRRKFGKMEMKDAKRLKELEKENTELKKIVADQMLNIKVLEAGNAKNGKPGTQAGSSEGSSEWGFVLATGGLALPEASLVQLLLPGQGINGKSHTPGGGDHPLLKGASPLRLSPDPGVARAGGLQVSRKFVQKVRRADGLTVQPPKKKQPHRGQSTGKIPTTATHPNHVWSWDFVADRTDEGAPLRVLSLIDEFSRECILLVVARSLKAADIIAALKKAIEQRGSPEHIRSDNGPEFIATATRDYLEKTTSKPSISSREAPGRTAMWRASTTVSGTSA